MQFGALTVEQWNELVATAEKATPPCEEKAERDANRSGTTTQPNDTKSIAVARNAPARSWASIASGSASARASAPQTDLKFSPNTLNADGLEESKPPQPLDTNLVASSLLTASPRVRELEVSDEYIPHGLTNDGNACFVNVVLQALFACTLFRSALLALSKQQIPSSCPLLTQLVRLSAVVTAPPQTLSSNPLSTGNAKSVAISKHTVENAWLGRESVRPQLFESCTLGEQPRDIPGADSLKVRSELREMVRRGTQEDAQEFLTHVLDVVHEEILQAVHLRAQMQNGTGGNHGGARMHEDRTELKEDDGDQEWEEVGKRGRGIVVRSSNRAEQESTFVSELFRGVLRSELKRARSKPSVTKEPFMCLQLEIDRPVVRELDDALRLYFEPESLEGYMLEATEQAVEAKKHFTIEALPEILVLHLKRFSYNSETFTLSKITKRITYPEELYIQSSFFASPTIAPTKEDRMYTLSAVVTHHGVELAGGHYTCDVRRSCNATSSSSTDSTRNNDRSSWVLCDDAKLKRESTENVMHRQAYLLFYSRRRRTAAATPHAVANKK